MYFLVISFLFVLGCSSNNTRIEVDENGNESFSSFYNYFYSDSSFQLGRIEFPMLRNERTMDNETPYWEMTNWEYLKKVDVDNDQIERFLYDLDGVIEENIIISRKFRIKNTYTLIDNQWFLTSYSGMVDLGRR